MIKRHALDYLGDPCANADCNFDFCDECMIKICEAINKTVETIKETK